MAEDFVSKPRTRPRTWNSRTRKRTRTQLFVLEAPRRRRQVLEDTSLHYGIIAVVVDTTEVIKSKIIQDLTLNDT